MFTIQGDFRAMATEKHFEQCMINRPRNFAARVVKKKFQLHENKMLTVLEIFHCWKYSNMYLNKIKLIEYVFSARTRERVNLT